MPTVTRTFTVEPAPATVIDYLKDFSHAEEWDPGTESCTRQDAGPVQVGSTFHNVSKIAGVTTELTYRLEELTPSLVKFRGENDSAETTDTITVTPSGTGSEIHYEAVIEAKGTAGKLAEPVMKLLFERIGTKTEKQMTEVLNRLTPGPASPA
ncbi:SRPBCC family protein [Nocardioides marinquilinus]|uniref:SRPBCC family protein n=1 Tax=Nocardioides marinquilinus TaxID=1210400 RepID=A0ABP9PLS0_9ACTN